MIRSVGGCECCGECQERTLGVAVVGSEDVLLRQETAVFDVLLRHTSDVSSCCVSDQWLQSACAKTASRANEPAASKSCVNSSPQSTQIVWRVI